MTKKLTVNIDTELITTLYSLLIVINNLIFFFFFSFKFYKFLFSIFYETSQS